MPNHDDIGKNMERGLHGGNEFVSSDSSQMMEFSQSIHEQFDASRGLNGNRLKLFFSDTMNNVQNDSRSMHYKTLDVAGIKFDELGISEQKEPTTKVIQSLQKDVNQDSDLEMDSSFFQLDVDRENTAREVPGSRVVGRQSHLENHTNTRLVARRKTRSQSVCSFTVSTFSAFSCGMRDNTQPKRSRRQLMMNSAIMFGREFCYAVEAGWTTPILLSIGLPANLYSLAWVISPILGFVLQPIVGNLSDRCTSRWGRRRPFILVAAIILMFGITFLLNGEHIVSTVFGQNASWRNEDFRTTVIAAITLTMVGATLFDFSADFIEGPIRAYAMDVCNEEDVKTCFLCQAIFTGLGGAFGYASGGVSWTRNTGLGFYFPSDRQVLYIACAVVFIFCCTLNLFSIPEAPLRKKSKTGESTILNNSKQHYDFGKSGCKGSTNQQLHTKKLKADGDGQMSSTNCLMEETGGPENALLLDLHRQHRNKLFEEYESSPIVSKHSRRITSSKKSKNCGRKPFSVKKRSFNAARSGPQRGAKPKIGKRFSTTKQITQVPYYGTFAHVDQPWQGLLQSGDLSRGAMLQPTAPALEDIATKVDSEHPNTYLHRSMRDSDALAARLIYPRFSKPQLGNNESDCDDEVFYSSLSDSDDSMERIMDRMGISSLAEADPGITTSKVSAFGEVTASNNKKKLSPESLFDGSETSSDKQDTGYAKRSGLICETGICDTASNTEEKKQAGSLQHLFRAVSTMPKELRLLCICHFLGWIAFLSSALFFTDFVGQVVMKGDPRAPRNSRLADNYKRGVEIGNWGLTINAASSAVYCVLLRPLTRIFGSRTMYVFGYLIFSIGTCVMATVPNVYVVLSFSSLIGIMSATLYTVPYFLVAQYHEYYKTHSDGARQRGKGIDCALVTCTIQLSQIITGLGIGALVVTTGTVTVTIATASIVAFVGALWAAFLVRY